MSVELVPAHQLTFHRPFTQHVKEILSVRNPNNLPVAFKVKTTAPKQYCVRPNSGRIDPGESVDVQVILQPMKEDPPPDFKCRDKFLVQSVPITPELETGSLQELWAAVEQNSRNSIKENKIRCVYLPSNNLEVHPTSGYTAPAQQLHNGGEERGHVDTTPIVQPQQQVYQYQPAQVTTSSSNLPAHISHNSTHDRNVATPVGGYSNASANVSPYPVEQSKPNNVITPIGNGDDNDVARLKRHLAEVQAENAKLKTKLETCKADLEQMQLRQRKMELEHDKAKSEKIASSKVNDGSQSALNVKTLEKVPVGYYPFEVLAGAAILAFFAGAWIF
ncbi:832_t:CDS:2 [Paraglomus occultum]|uniref:832_t:CDS:1 n=1 Tax=Paraglomus occultum TaxID=144539 RepID=A0A9N9B0C0_9GLOM|nr:832_t:CDS:2 [Paraglomus occultum]